MSFTTKETLLQTSQPLKTKNLEIKVKKPGDLGRNLEVYQRHQKELKPGVRKTWKWKWIAKNTFNRIRTFPFCFELSLHLMNFPCFPPFWHCVRNVSKCDKLVTITLFGFCLVNKMIKYDEWRWICLRTVDFYIIDAWKSLFRGKNENIQKVYSIGLWICLPWDFCASSWDYEIVLKTMRLERSALGWREACPMLWQIYARHCIVMKILYESTRIKNKKYNEKLNNAMYKFGWVLDKYGGGGWYVCP